MMKCVKFLGVFLFFLLAGCGGEDVRYDAKLFKPDENNCWPCTMYWRAFNAIDNALDGCMEKISQNSLIILELGLLFWLLFRVMRLVISLSMPDMKKEIASFATVLFKAMIVAIFLHNASFMYEFWGKVVIQPLGDGFLSMANSVLETPSELGINFNYTTGVNWADEILNTLTGKQDSKMFGKLATTVQAIVYQIHNALWSNVGLGIQLWANKGLSSAIAGLILIGGMFWLMLMVPLCFVDAFVRIGMVLILSPLLMVGWVFSYPKDIISKVAHSLFAGFFDILFNCIYITFLISTFRVYENQEMPYMFSASVQTTEGGMRAVAAQFGTDFLILTLLAWSMIKLAEKVQDFSNYFFEGAQKSSVFAMVNKMKNLAMKGVRLGAALMAGPGALAKEAANLAKEGADAAKEMGEGENQEGADDKKNDDGKKEESKPPKEGNK